MGLEKAGMTKRGGQLVQAEEGETTEESSAEGDFLKEEEEDEIGFPSRGLGGGEIGWTRLMWA